MIGWIKQWVGGSGANRKLSLAVKADHVELSSEHLVIGLKLDWGNLTDEPIPIKEVAVMVHLGERGQEPLRFYPLERFARVTTHRALQKSPVRPFTLPPGEIYSEQFRFISQEILDIPPDNYTVDVQLIDTSDTTYTNRTKIQLSSKLKYRRSEEWGETEGED